MAYRNQQEPPPRKQNQAGEEKEDPFDTVFALAATLGPILPNWAYRMSHNYEPVLSIFGAILEVGYFMATLATVVVLSLFPYSPEERQATEELHLEARYALFFAPLGLYLATKQGNPLVLKVYWSIVLALGLYFYWEAGRRLRRMPKESKPVPNLPQRVVIRELGPGPESPPEPQGEPQEPFPFPIHWPERRPPKTPEEARNRLRSTLYLPEDLEEEIIRLLFLLRHHQEFRKTWNLDVPTTLLLTGPPGTGKTSVARFLALEGGYPLISVTPSLVVSKWYGEGEKNLALLFRKARKLAPSVIYVDELEALALSRTSSHEATAQMVAELLSQLDGLASDRSRDRPVFFLGSTNHPELLDPALLSRFTATLHISLPDRTGRARILALLLGERAGDLDLEAVAARLEGMSGRDLRTLVQRAATGAMLRGSDRLTERDLLEEAARMLPRG